MAQQSTGFHGLLDAVPVLPFSSMDSPPEEIRQSHPSSSSGGNCTKHSLNHLLHHDAKADQQGPLKLVALKRRGRKAHLPKMNNSERGKYYRGKRKQYNDQLQFDVDQLREYVKQLQTLRDIRQELAVATRVNPSGSLVKIVREYVAQFRHGVQLPPSRRNMKLLPEVEISTTSQESFMNAMMEPDVRFGEFQGIATVMDQWCRYSQYHALLVFELSTVEVTGTHKAPIVRTTGFLRTRYSRTTIENVFPHIVGNEPLIQKLVGREIVYPCANQFYFTAQGRIQRYDVEADFPQALLNALDSVDDVVLLLGQALIKQQHMMGELDEQNDVMEQTAAKKQHVASQYEVAFLLHEDDDTREDEEEAHGTNT